MHYLKLILTKQKMCILIMKKIITVSICVLLVATTNTNTFAQGCVAIRSTGAFVRLKHIMQVILRAGL